MSFNIFNQKVTDGFSMEKPQEFESEKERAEFYYKKYTEGLKKTIKWNDNVGWTTESKEIIHSQIAPKVAEMEELVGQILQNEGKVEIDQLLAEKPVANIKVTTVDGVFAIIDTQDGRELTRGDTKTIKEFLEIVHKMQSGNPTTAPVGNQEKPQPIAEDKDDNKPF